jgi:RNA polymerase sigma factor (sigma-70 family)
MTNRFPRVLLGHAVRRPHRVDLRHDRRTAERAESALLGLLALAGVAIAALDAYLPSPIASRPPCRGAAQAIYRPRPWPPRTGRIVGEGDPGDFRHEAFAAYPETGDRAPRTLSWQRRIAGGDRIRRQRERTLVALVDSDAQLIAQACRRPERFAEVFDRHYRHIFSFAARRLGPDLAEDVASETFLIAFDRRTAYDPSRPDARPWLYGIASNLIARHDRAESRRYKALARVGISELFDDPDDLAVARRVDASRVRTRLADALERLPRSLRDVLLLVAWAGLTREEAAAALDIPSGTARSRLHRARQDMRAALGAEAEAYE